MAVSGDEINEGSSGFLSVSFTDKDGALESPTSISYRIDDDVSGDEVLGDTAIAAAAAIEIPLPPSVNFTIGAENTQKRLVTVVANYGADDAIKKVFNYVLINLRFA